MPVLSVATTERAETDLARDRDGGKAGRETRGGGGGGGVVRGGGGGGAPP